jgi:Na+/H+ antiporter NhaD/arsenite permease-like protein
MEIALILAFVIGYIAIATEHNIGINKAATALLTGVVCWVIYIVGVGDVLRVERELTEHLGEISGILFFLLGAMTIVELIDAHDGFQLITDRINTRNKRQLFWVLGLITFFLSAVLDNLTTAIVMVSLLRKLMRDREDRLYFAGLVVIAANAGGAWSPIGDVTTTMLWVGGQVSSSGVIGKVFLPSLVSLLVPILFMSFLRKGQVEPPPHEDSPSGVSPFQRQLVLGVGISALLFVPAFKVVTHLPPFMGMLFSLGVVWVFTEILGRKRNLGDKSNLSVLYALRKIDTPSILFFLGILISVAALQSSQLLPHVARALSEKIGNESLIVMMIGLISSVVDNVPLVAAVQGMYRDTYPLNHEFWNFLAYTAGTGGSCLIIGSAAGVAAMGMEDIHFGWYLKRISGLALLGYFAGAATYLLCN